MPSRVRGAAVIGAVAAAAALLVPVLTAQAQPMPDPDETTPAAVSALHTVTPGVLGPDVETVTLAGTVRNTSEVPVHNVQVLPRFSAVPLASRTTIGDISTVEDLHWGRRYGEAYQVVTDELQPGQTRPFELHVPTATLNFAAGSGVYALGIDVMASPPDSGERIRLHTSRTVVPWLAAAAELPTVPVALVWPLADRPALLPDGRFLDDSLAEQIRAGQPLDGLVDAATGAPVTWVIDPDLVDTVQAMVDGYEVAAGSGPAAGSGTAQAQRWQAALLDATNDRPVRLLPYAMPDLPALSSHDADLAAALAQRSVAEAQRHTDTWPDGRTLAWLDGGPVAEAAVDVALDAGVNRVLVTTDPEPSALSETTGQSAGPAAVITPDIGLSDALSDAARAGDPQVAALQARQRWLAETAMIARESAGSGTAPAALIAAPPLRWRPDPMVASSVIATMTSIPWVTPVALDAVVDTVPTRPATADTAASALSAARVSAVADLHDQAQRYLALVADPDQHAAQLTLSAVRAASSGWREDAAAGDRYTTTVTANLADRMSQVRVTVPESVTLSSSTGVFPLTVINDLPEPVDVRLDIRSANVDRLRIEPVDLQRIDAGQRIYVDVTAQAAANGKVPIDVQLTAVDGAPIGPSQRTIVNATEYGTIGWVIVGAAALLFGLAMGRRVIRARRRRGPDSDESAPTTQPTDAEQPLDAPAVAREPAP